MGSDEVRHSGENLLTRAEREVLAVLLTGAHNRQIAEQLFVTEATVRTHLTHIYSKLDVDGRAALIATFRVEAVPQAPMPAPARPRRDARMWIVAGIALIVIVGFVANIAFNGSGERGPSWAPASAPAVRVVPSGPDAVSALPR